MAEKRSPKVRKASVSVATPGGSRGHVSLGHSTGLCSVGLFSLGLGGCALRGAPSYSIFGAFFPAWLLCAALGAFGSILLRNLLIAVDIEEAVPFKLLVYLAFAVASSLWLWLALFGES